MVWMEMVNSYCGCVTIHIFGSVLCRVDVVQNDIIELDHPICLNGPLPFDVDLSGA